MSRQKNNITVKEFVDKYIKLSSDSLKDKLVESIIYRTYVPILEKKLFLQAVFDKSLTGQEPNRYVDVFVNKINVTIAVLQLYTDLDFKKTENDKDNKMFVDYDLLAENDLLNKIFNQIPESELKSFLSINDQITETFYNEHNSTEAFLTKLTDRFSVTFGAIANGSINALLEVLNDEEKLNGIVDNLIKNNVNIGNIVQLVKKLKK